MTVAQTDRTIGPSGAHGNGRRWRCTARPIASIDDTPSSQRVLETGFKEAYRRGCALVAVRTVEADAPRGPARPAGGLRTVVAVEVTEAVARLQDRYPTVPVEVELATGNTADVLVAASRSAQLIVLNRHRHSGLLGPSLDPVTHHLLQRSDCPVLVLRDTGGDPLAR